MTWDLNSQSNVLKFSIHNGTVICHSKCSISTEDSRDSLSFGMLNSLLSQIDGITTTLKLNDDGNRHPNQTMKSKDYCEKVDPKRISSRSGINIVYNSLSE